MSTFGGSPLKSGHLSNQDTLSRSPKCPHFVVPLHYTAPPPPVQSLPCTDPNSLVLCQEDVVSLLVAGIVEEQHEESVFGSGRGDRVGGLGDGILLTELGEVDPRVSVQPLHLHNRLGGVVLHTVDVVALGAGKHKRWLGLYSGTSE